MASVAMGVMRRTSIATRVALAPFVVLVLSVVLLVVSDRQAQEALTSVDSIHVVAAERRGHVDSLVATLFQVHSDVSRHLALVDSGTSEAKLAGIRAAIDTNLARANKLVVTLKSDGAALSEGGVDVIADLEGRLGKYAKAVAQMNDMAQSDRLIAIPLMTHVDKQFTELEAKAETVQAGIEADAVRSADATRAAAEAAAHRLWWVDGVLLTAFSLLTLQVVRSITGPLAQLIRGMSEISHGRLDTEIAGTDATDEVGGMARALEVFKANALDAARLRMQQELMAEAVERDKLRALEAMAETVERETRTAVDQVSQQTLQMADDARGMAESAAAVSDNSRGVAAAANLALNNAQTVAAATEQLSASIREIAQQVGTATQMTGVAVAASSRAQATIGTLSDTVLRIGEVANMIKAIASQTNLLALNATIEAARAGEAGKGFAVVANEVKNLASQTAKATEEIASQIAAVQIATADAVAAVGEINAAIGSVENVSTAVAAAIEEQGAATSEIARSVTQTSDAAQEVATRIAEVSSEANDTGTRAAGIGRISSLVAHSIDELRRALVHVVRTSSAEVNRRTKPRYQVNRAATLTIGEMVRQVVIDNMSEDGFMAICEGERIPAGIRMILALDGAPNLPPAVVKICEHGHLHAKFEATGEALERWQRDCATLVGGMVELKDAA
jgi:methyl-accepting chemotaxis protein